MDTPKDIWHFARPLLAKQYLGEFDLGLISARALFAKRRMGKSTFLERDLIPAAKQALESAYDGKKRQFEEAALTARLDAEWVDLTAGAPRVQRGGRSPQPSSRAPEEP